MLTRTRHDVVEFRRPFRLAGEDMPCPAGRWIVQTEEELIEPLSFAAWRRTATTIRLHGAAAGQTVRTIPVTPTELAALRAVDTEPA
ncbi:MAG: hypothetical protein K2X74_23175 [Acetobacteraceae bacterium]|nr:hypothetical protein [Acetobacteraceae bacterium]